MEEELAPNLKSLQEQMLKRMRERVRQLTVEDTKRALQYLPPTPEVNEFLLALENATPVLASIPYDSSVEEDKNFVLNFAYWVVTLLEIKQIEELVARTKEFVKEGEIPPQPHIEKAKQIAYSEAPRFLKEKLQELIKTLTQRAPQAQPTPDPFTRSLAPFASGAPAWGAVEAIFKAKKGWPLDEEGRPRFVVRIDGPKMRGMLSYHVILPAAASDEQIALAHKELAYEILRTMGPDTAWLHMLVLAYVAQVDPGKPAVIPREAVYRALGIKDRSDLSRKEKDRRCKDEINRLQSLGLSILRLELAGKHELNYSRRITHLWHLSIDEHGQARFEEENGQWVRRYEDWHLLVRPGEWGDLFLYGQPMRQLGYMARDMFEKIDRRRAPWGAALAVLLTFRSRFEPGPRIRVTNQELIEFAGGDPYPEDRRKRHEIQRLVLNAILEQPKWGWRVDLVEWPSYLRPDLDADRADGIVNEGSDGTDATPRRLPPGYWDDFIRAATWFEVPRELMESNMKAASLPPKPAATRQKQAALQPHHRSPSGKPWLASDLLALRKRCGMTQAEMGEYLGGLSHTAIRHMEKGKRSIPKRYWPRLNALAEKFPETSS